MRKVMTPQAQQTLLVCDEAMLERIVRNVLEDCFRKYRRPDDNIKGLRALAKALNVGYSTVNSWKHQGKLEGSYVQYEKTIIFRSLNVVIETLKNNNVKVSKWRER